MKSYLKLTCLWLIKKEPTNGWRIYKDIRQIKGKYPSRGNLYDTLKTLSYEGFIEAKKKNRSTFYSITNKGHKLLNELVKDFFKDLEDLIYLGKMIDYRYKDKDIEYFLKTGNENERKNKTNI